LVYWAPQSRELRGQHEHTILWSLAEQLMHPKMLTTILLTENFLLFSIRIYQSSVKYEQMTRPKKWGINKSKKRPRNVHRK